MQSPILPIPPIICYIRWNTLHSYYDALVSSGDGNGGKQGVGNAKTPEEAFGYALMDYCAENRIKF